MKIIIGAFAAVLLLIGGFFALNSYIYNEKQADDEARTIPYSNNQVGIEFAYRDNPNGHVLLEPPVPSDQPDVEKILVLMLKSDHEAFTSASVPGEAPPTITILAFKNPDQRAPEAWANENAALSSIKMTGGDIKPVVVGGVPGIRYMVDGLYMADTIVIANGDRVYLISGMFMDENSDIRRDFQPLVDSIKFRGANQAMSR